MSAGTKLGPYEIIATIGAGGMGIVYRARPAARAHVAIKVSAERFSDRFEREARRHHHPALSNSTRNDRRRRLRRRSTIPARAKRSGAIHSRAELDEMKQ
jgi:hypothetical protein